MPRACHTRTDGGSSKVLLPSFRDFRASVWRSKRYASATGMSLAMAKRA